MNNLYMSLWPLRLADTKGFRTKTDCVIEECQFSIKWFDRTQKYSDVHEIKH